MKSDALDVWQLLKTITGIDKLPLSLLATVKDIDEGEMTCTVSPIDGSSDFMDVYLMADPQSTGFYYKPTIGSIVLISPQNKNTYFISMFSSLDKVLIRGDANGGVPITSNVVDKLNNLENLVNDLISKYNSHTHILTLSAGTGTAAPTTTTETDTLTPTTNDDIQSTTVKHG